ncbi:hypothetical protein DPX28_09665 [Enterococcus faecium]|nr:hypothetical protein DPX28_09665 [Enterococcus faecium]HAP7719816.1 hypothetical protein [Enterococcus faecium]HAQ8299681.1 hypothetical protein [Enterococcus faecium]HAQ9351392.1 hypothetical protein [Enterococcus faecium]HAQ9408138.1 hypothetical protein [Enterococcus faecium]
MSPINYRAKSIYHWDFYALLGF